MIKFRDQVPSVYSKASRDFQYLGWLIDIVLNYIKHNVDNLYDLPNTQANPKLTELLAMTLGFKVRRNYDSAQLKALVAVLPRILRFKGTKTAIDIVGNALLSASGASGKFSSKISDSNSYELEVIFPIDLIDVALFTDLLPYILPVGMTCHIIRRNEEQFNCDTELDYEDKIVATWVSDLDYEDKEAQIAPGLSNMFAVGETDPAFSNYFDSNVNKLNIGLLDNSIIPMVFRPMEHTASENSNKDTDDSYTLEQNEYGYTVVIDKYTQETVDGDTTTIIGGD